MAVYGNRIDTCGQLIKSVYESNTILESIDSNIINEGVGQALKKAWNVIIEGIKTAIKAIGRFITMVIGKVKSIFKKEKKENTENAEEEIKIKKDNSKEPDIEGFMREKEEFEKKKLVDINDAIKINFSVKEKGNFYTLWKVINNIESRNDDTVNGTYGRICSKRRNMVYYDEIKEEDILKYEDLLELDNSNVTVKDYIDKKYYISSHKGFIMNLLNDCKQSIIKSESTFKKRLSVLKELQSACEKYYNSSDDEDDMELLRKICMILDKIEEFDINIYKDNNSDSSNNDISSMIDKIFKRCKFRIKGLNNVIMVLSRYIPLLMRVRNSYLYLNNYIRSRQFTIMQKYNVTSWNLEGGY